MARTRSAHDLYGTNFEGQIGKHEVENREREK